MQAELWFGVEQSKEKTLDDFVENFSTFIENGDDWANVNQSILDFRNNQTQKSFPSIQQLADVVKYEVAYQIAMWKEDYVEALDQASTVIGLLTDSELRGYRVLWEYLAGSAATLAKTHGGIDLSVRARQHFSRAKAASLGIPWLVRLAQSKDVDMPYNDADREGVELMRQVEKIEATLTSLGTVHVRRYAERESEILEGLKDPELFEEAHTMLGTHLGFDANNVESSASPDPWWQSGHLCLVFEDHAKANAGSSLSATKARQAASHPNWMRENVSSCQSESTEIFPILVTPVSTTYPDARTHLTEVLLWTLGDFLSWASYAMNTIRELRKTFPGTPDLVWRESTGRALKDAKLDMPSIVAKLKQSVAKDILVDK